MTDFQDLIDAHRKIIFKVCTAQEIILQLWRAYPGFDGRVKFSTWMYRIALNVAISFYRSQRRHTRHLVDDEAALLNVIDESGTPSDEMRAVWQIIEGLDELNRALVLLFLDGNSHAEIAAVLGISESNAATKLGRIRQQIRRQVQRAA
jgi:RNA polymerase sigma-70 factor (ECF subfamily)